MSGHGQTPLRQRMATKRVFASSVLLKVVHQLRANVEATPHPVIVTDSVGTPCFALISLELLMRLEAMLGLEEGKSDG